MIRTIIAMDLMNNLKDSDDLPVVTSSNEKMVKKSGEFNSDPVLMDITLKGNKDGIDAAVEVKNKFDLPAETDSGEKAVKKTG